MRVESQVRVPVEQAQLINPGAFRFDTSQAQAIGNIGAVISELGKRKEDMQDRISVSNANAATKKAQLDYQQEIIGKPLDQHAAILQKHVNFAKATALNQKMSGKARTLATNNLNVWGQGFAETGELANVMALHKEDRIRVTSDLGESLVVGNSADIEAAEKAFDDHFAADPEAGQKVKEGIGKNAVKQMKANAVAAVQEIAARTPNAVIVRIEKEQELRKTKKPEDFPMLDSKDLEAARDYAMTVGEKAKSQSTQAKNQVITDNYASIADGGVNISEMIQDIVSDPNISAEDKPEAIEKTRTFFSGWHSTKMADRVWPLVDDDAVVQDLETLLTAQKSGTKDINEVNEKINDAANNSKLTKDTRDSLRVKSRKGGNDAIDDSVNQYTGRVANALIGRLTEREARFKIRETAGDLTLEERRQASSTGFLLQVGKEQLNRFKIDLDKRIREIQGGRETISGVEASAIAASVWETYKTKTDSQKIQEFKEFAGGTVPRPEGFSFGEWSGYSNTQKSDIISAIDQGMSMAQIKEFISK